MKRKPIEYEVNENGCNLCTSHSLNKDGYPTMGINGKKVFIHRYVYEQNYEKIPDGMVVRHKCDVRNCINPLHLDVGSQFDNVQDMIKRGRKPSRKGELNGRSKLTEMDVRVIRKNKLSSYKICKLYNVCPSTVRMIRQYRRWSHVA